MSCCSTHTAGHSTRSLDNQDEKGFVAVLTSLRRESSSSSSEELEKSWMNASKPLNWLEMNIIAVTSIMQHRQQMMQQITRGEHSSFRIVQGFKVKDKRPLGEGR